MVVADRLCTFLIDYAKDGKAVSVNANDLKQRLMSNDESVKIEAMKQLLTALAGGERLPQLLMPVIQYIVPSQNHTLKKLALLYWEVSDKKGPNGNLLAEMILVINFLRMDLNSPNEYVRGATLRLLSKIRSAEILEDLVSSVAQNLEHRHSYVRRNAVLAVHSIYKAFPFLMPDAPEHIEKFLGSESDASARRNAFYMLFDTAPDRAVTYLVGLQEDLLAQGEMMQLVLVDAMRRFCRAGHPQKPVLFKMLFKLLQSETPAVMYQCAATIMSLSGSPTAVRAVASAFARLLAKESDTNVRLIVLDRLREIRDRHPHVLEDFIMDILTAVETPSADVRRKALDIALGLVSQRNAEEVVLFLRKQIVRALAPDGERSPEFCKLLIDAVHSCVVRFPETADAVVNVLMDFLAEPTMASLPNAGSGLGVASPAVEVVLFVRELMELFPAHREQLLAKLREMFADVSSGRVLRTALWILGDYADNLHAVMAAYECIVHALGSMPLDAAVGSSLTLGLKSSRDDDASSVHSMQSQGTQSTFATSASAAVSARINADGTYATQSAVVGPSSRAPENALHLRRLLRGGDYYLATVLASTLTKLCYRVHTLHHDDAVKQQVQTDVMMVLASLLRLGRQSHSLELNASSAPSLSVTAAPSHNSLASTAGTKKTVTVMDEDSFERIALCMTFVHDIRPEYSLVILQKSRDVFAQLIANQKAERDRARENAARELDAPVPVDQPLTFRLLRPQRGGDIVEMDDDAELERAVGMEEKEGTDGKVVGTEAFMARLRRITQLTGFSDPVYAEAYVSIHQYDIIVDVTIVNQTNDTLDNVVLELQTMGDLRLCEKPQVVQLAAFEKRTVRASIKVSSTDNGSIFGSILYDQPGTTGPAGGEKERRAVVLSDIHIDIMEYIKPSRCSDVQFRAMWAEFEWENKVPINTEFADLSAFLAHISRVTNMQCLTDDAASDPECPFLSANLYARSTFGEDALANVSVERVGESRVVGYVRIRSKTQGIALSLGDRITTMQRPTITSTSAPAAVAAQ
jgi:coatomer subunit beta